MKFTGWLSEDVINFTDCPKCQQLKTKPCRYPSGTKKVPPHPERVLEYNRKYPETAPLYRGSENHAKVVREYNERHSNDRN